MNTNETPLRQNQFTESNLANDYIDVDPMLNEINDSLTRNDETPETVNAISDTNFNDMLHNVQYLMDEVIKEFIDECFIKDVIFGENSVYGHFYNEVRANNHGTIANNNSNNACITKNVNIEESTIRYDKITIHPNSNFNNITGANIIAINEDNKINNISKVTILNGLIKKCKYFLEKVQNLIAILRKQNTNQIS